VDYARIAFLLQIADGCLWTLTEILACQ
jgi:hypothetical protein